MLVRSFARIHETNLKKQGILPLTFADPADYGRILKDDRLSVLGVEFLAPQQGLTVELRHADGTRECFETLHSLTPEQVAWFMAGSALNLIRLRRDTTAR